MTIFPERPDTANSIAPLRVRVRDERGIALVIAMMAVILLTGLGIALVLLTNTETMITANYRNSQETLYAADAAVETVVQDLLLEADWNQLLAGQVHSGFFDPSATVTLGDGSSVNVNALLTDLQHETDALNFWGLNDATWQ